MVPVRVPHVVTVGFDNIRFLAEVEEGFWFLGNVDKVNMTCLMLDFYMNQAKCRKFLNITIRKFSHDCT